MKMAAILLLLTCGGFVVTAFTPSCIRSPSSPAFGLFRYHDENRCYLPFPQHHQQQSSTSSSTTTTTACQLHRRLPSSFSSSSSSASRSTSRVVLFMGWGPEPVWSSAQLLSIQDACVSGKSVSVVVQVPLETAAAYTIPGQYVQLRRGTVTAASMDDDSSSAGVPVTVSAAAAAELTDAAAKPYFVESSSTSSTPAPPAAAAALKPLFLAIASPPNAEVAQFEFLIKKTPDNAWLTNAATSTTTTSTSSSSSTNSIPPLEISQVLGSGFPVADNLDGFKYDFPTQNVLLFAAGSGIAPIRAALEASSGSFTSNNNTSSSFLKIAKPGQGGRSCRLYYGEQTPDDLCFVHKYATWEANGIQVVPVISQLSDNEDWQGRTGYVQNALEEDGVAIPRNSAALLCGMKGMVESVTAILTKAGVFAGRVLTNF